MMPLPPLYKYLDVQGAKLTLGNGTFKHAKPSDFNDTEDLTIPSVFPEETGDALEKIINGVVDVILQHLNDPPTCRSPMKSKVLMIQHLLRTNPKAADFLKTELKRGKPIYDVDHMRETANNLIRDLNDLMQDYRILCVTIHKDSEKMWTDYAENHKGIALRIEADVNNDSKFQLFRPVEYHKKRPPLYDSTLSFIGGALFGDQHARLKANMEKVILAKTLSWQHEGEYRLAIPLSRGEPSWNTLHYYPDEITELYLGLAMTEEDKDDIVAKAKARNPKIAIFQVARDMSGKLTSTRFEPPISKHT